MPTTPKKFMQDVFNSCTTAFAPAFFQNREGLAKLTEAITESVPMAALDCAFAASLVPTGNKKWYTRVTFNIFLIALPNTDTDASQEASRGLLQVIAAEIAQRLRERQEWYLVPANSFESITPQLQYFSEQFDERTVVLSMSTDAVIDLSLDIQC